MAKVITIKVKDGEITIPTIGKIVNGKKVERLIRVIKEYWATSGVAIQYFYPSTCGGGSCSADAWTTDELVGLAPCSVAFWNKTVKEACYKLEQASVLTKDNLKNTWGE